MAKKFVPLDQKLTKLEEEFVEAYCSNGYRADLAYLVIKPGTEPKKVKGNAYHWRQALNDHIDKRRKEKYEELYIDQMHILESIADIAFADKDDDVYTTMHKLKALDMLAKAEHLYEKQEDKQTEQTIHITIDGD